MADALAPKFSSPRTRLALLAGVWGALCLVAAVVIDHLGRGTTFFYDEWTWILQRRHGMRAFLEPHNGHLSVVPCLAFRTMFAIFGLEHYRPYRWMAIGVHLLVATLVAEVARRRTHALVGLAAGSVVLFLGSGWQNIFWPFQIGFMGSVAAGLAAWLALDRRDARGDVMAAVALGVALGCSGVGVAVTGGVVVRCLIEGRWRRSQAWFAAPVALYLAWTAGFGSSQLEPSGLGSMARYVGRAASGAVAALGGRGTRFGDIGVVVCACLALAALYGPRVRVARVLGALAVPTSSWVLTAAARAQVATPTASRYVYNGAIFLVLVAVEGLAGRRWASVAPLGLGACALAAASVWGNWWIMVAGSAGLRETSGYVAAELRALEWARAFVPSSYAPDRQRVPPLDAGSYFAATDDLGSPAFTDAAVAAAPIPVRAVVDGVSLAAVGSFHFEPLGPDAPTCSLGEPGRAATAALTSGGVVVVSTGRVELRARRVAAAFPATPNATLDLPDQVRVVLPIDEAPADWQLEARPASPDVAVCLAG